MLDFDKLKRFVSDTTTTSTTSTEMLNCTIDEYSQKCLIERMENICTKFIKLNDKKELIKINKDVSRKGDKSDPRKLGVTFVKAYNERYKNLNRFFLKFTEKSISKWSSLEISMFKKRMKILKNDKSKFKGWGIESIVFPNKNGNQLERASDLTFRRKRKRI